MVDRLPRCVAVAAAASLGYAALAAWLLPVALGGSTETLDRALVRGCALLAVPVASWVWCCTVVTVVDAARGSGRRTRGVPAPVRRAVLAACGVALSGGLALAPAQATPGQQHEDRAAGPAAAVAGLPLPDRAAAVADAAAVMAAPGLGRTSVVVAAGDTLWAIAADTLAADATDAEVTARWQQIYDLNRDVVGPDPDLIQPAQRLQVPLP